MTIRLREVHTTDLRERLQATLAGAYELEHELGGGGMSRVFLAHETALGRRVVVKVLLPTLAAGVSAERFRREILLVAKLQHPHIVPVHAAGESEGLPWFTMPFVEGESLRARIAREGELPIPEVLRLLRDIASALSYAHAQGVIHRDIKPDNVLLSNGSAVVADFGVAKALSDSVTDGDSTHLTSLGIALGTPAYMAPEQASADPAMDHRVDIYAFGVMAYEMIAGRPPFTGRNPQAMFVAHVTEPPPPLQSLRPAAPAALTALVMRCLEKHAADRPTGADEILHALDSMTTPSGGNPPTKEFPSPRRTAESAATRRVPWQWIATVLAAAAVVAAMVLMPGGTDGTDGTDGTAGTAETAGAGATGSASRGREVEVTAGNVQRTDPSTTGALRTDAARTDPARTDAARTDAARTDPARTDTARTDRLRTQPPSRRAAEPPQPEPSEPSQPSQPSQPPAEAAQPSAEPAQPPAPPVPSNPRPAVESIVTAYANAIESRSTARIRDVFPGLTATQERDWRQFFDAVGTVQATLSLTDLQVTDDVAEATATGEYVFENTTTRRTERQPASVRMTFRRAPDDTWRLTAVR